MRRATFVLLLALGGPAHAEPGERATEPGHETSRGRRYGDERGAGDERATDDARADEATRRAERETDPAHDREAEQRLAARLARKALRDRRAAGLAETRPRFDGRALDDAVTARDPAAARAALFGGVLEVVRANLRLGIAGSPPRLLRKVRGADRADLYLVPSASAYGEDAWKWDLVFGAMVAERAAAYTDDHRLRRSLHAVATGSLLTALRNQITDGPNRGRTPHLNIRSRAAAELFGDFITQPDVIPMGVRALHDRRLRRELYPAVSAELDYWIAQRLDGDLPFVVHPWETGEDASVDQDATLKRWIDLGAPAELANQTRHDGKKAEGPLVGRFNLARALRQLEPGFDAAEAGELYRHQSASMAAHVVRSLEDGAVLADEVGARRDGKRYRAAAERIRQAARAKLWSRAHELFLSRNADGLIEAEVASSFVTLAAGIPSDDQARAMLTVLTDKKKFWTDAPIPTVAADDPRFRADEYWRGSTWINVNHLVVERLRRYAEHFEAEGDGATARRFAEVGRELGWKTVGLTAGGFDEYYRSKGGQPAGGIGAPGRFTWSTLTFTTIDLIERLDAVAKRHPAPS